MTPGQQATKQQQQQAGKQSQQDQVAGQQVEEGSQQVVVVPVLNPDGTPAKDADGQVNIKTFHSLKYLIKIYAYL